jgi:hypothetical protein
LRGMTAFTDWSYPSLEILTNGRLFNIFLTLS